MREDVERHVEPKVMQVLLTLASRPAHVFSKEELISSVWNQTFVSDDVLTRCISILRRVTEDDAHRPHFIQTIPRVGYRLVAPIFALEAVASPDVEAVQVPVAPAPLATHEVSVPARVLSPSTLRRFAVWPLFLVAALLCCGLAWAWMRFAVIPASRKPSFRVVQFTSFPGEQTEPAFSPNGDRIAFVWTGEGTHSQRIYIKKIGEEAAQELTPGSERNEQQFSPAWSPDGHAVAYLGKDPSGLGLFLAGIGSPEPSRKVYIPQVESQWTHGALSWAPNGKSLVFADHLGSQPNSSIFQLDLASGTVRPITSPPVGWEGDLTPAYSPDGRKIAFTRASETSVRDVCWMSLADGRVHQLTHDRSNIDSLAWNRDGASIIFSSNRGGKNALWTVALTKDQPERLQVGTEDAAEPAIGPEPDQLAYTQGSAIWSIVQVQGSKSKRTGGQLQTITSSTQQDSAPSLSPDGNSFAMQSLRSGTQEIWIVSLRDGALHQLTSMGGPLTGSPAWSHHDDRILFDSRPDGHSHIFLVAAAGGEARQLTFGNANDIVPRWSEDDQTIYFRSNRGGRWQLWRMSAHGSDFQPVTTGDGIEPRESTDRKWIYYTRGDDNGIWRISTAGGSEVQISKQPSGGNWGYWDLTGEDIFYLDSSQTPATIKVLDTATEHITTFATLGSVPPPYSGLTVAQGGLVLLMTDERNAGRHITLVSR